MIVIDREMKCAKAWSGASGEQNYLYVLDIPPLDNQITMSGGEERSILAQIVPPPDRGLPPDFI